MVEQLWSKRSGFGTYLRCVVSLSKILYSPKVLVILRKQWLCSDMPEKLLTGMLNLNTNKQIIPTLSMSVKIQHAKSLSSVFTCTGQFDSNQVINHDSRLTRNEIHVGMILKIKCVESQGNPSLEF